MQGVLILIYINALLHWSDAFLKMRSKAICAIKFYIWNTKSEMWGLPVGHAELWGQGERAYAPPFPQQFVLSSVTLTERQGTWWPQRGAAGPSSLAEEARRSTESQEWVTYFQNEDVCSLEQRAAVLGVPRDPSTPNDAHAWDPLPQPWNLTAEGCGVGGGTYNIYHPVAGEGLFPSSPWPADCTYECALFISRSPPQSHCH